MAEATETVQSVKTDSDGIVKIAVEKYTELLDTINSQKISIADLKNQLTQARNYVPPVINRTIIEKTPEMVAQDNRVWGGTFLGLSASMFIDGAIRLRRGLAES